MSDDDDEYIPNAVATAAEHISMPAPTATEPTVVTQDVDNSLRRLRTDVKGAVRCVCISPCGRVLCAGGDDGKLCMWDFSLPPKAHCEPTRVITPFVNRISGFQSIVALQMASDGSYFIACQDGDQAALFSSHGAHLGLCAMGERGVIDITLCKGHRRPVTCCSLHGTNPGKFFTASQDGSARMWDRKTFTFRSEYVVKHGTGQLDDDVVVESVCGLKGLCGGQGFATGGEDGRVQLWDTRVKYRPGASVAAWDTYAAIGSGIKVFEKHVNSLVEDCSGALMARVEDAVIQIDTRGGSGGCVSKLELPSLPPCASGGNLAKGKEGESFLCGTACRGFRSTVGGHVVQFSCGPPPVTTAWCAGRADEDVTSVCSHWDDCGKETVFAGTNKGDLVVRTSHPSCIIAEWFASRVSSDTRHVGDKSARQPEEVQLRDLLF